MSGQDEYNDTMAKRLLGRSIKPTEIEPECDTSEFEARVDEEVERLLDNPSELMEVDIDYIMSLYRLRRHSWQHLGKILDEYIRDMAEKQARDVV